MVMETPPSPQCVGREFVRQYYTLLHEAPAHLHRFYNHNSSFIHGGLDPPNRETAPVVGQKQIHQKIQQLNFSNSYVKISQVDSQATLGNGVVVQVTGELSNAGLPMRKFTQTFVLAAQSPKKYYVHNDIFRYQDMLTDEEQLEELKRQQELSNHNEDVSIKPQESIENAMRSNESLNPTQNPAAYYTPPAATTILQQVVTSTNIISPQTVSTQTMVNGTSAIPVHQLEMATINQQTKVLPVQESTPQHVIISTPMKIEEEAPLPPRHLTSIHNNQSAPDIIVSSQPMASAVTTAEVIDEPKPESIEETLEVINTDVSNDVVEENEIKSEEEKEESLPPPPVENRRESSTPSLSEPKTYANLLKGSSSLSNTSSISYQQSLPQQPVPPINTHQVSNQHTSKMSPPGHHIFEKRSRPPRPDNQHQRNNSFIHNRNFDDNDSYNGGDGDRRRPFVADNNQVFMGNLPHTATETELREIFGKFGTILDLRIHSKPGGKNSNNSGRVPNYGFIIYEDISSVNAVLNAKPIIYSDGSETGVKLNVEEKKKPRRIGSGIGSGGGGGRINSGIGNRGNNRGDIRGGTGGMSGGPRNFGGGSGRFGGGNVNRR